MSTPYSEVDDMFLSDISDETFIDYAEEEQNAILQNLRIKAITMFKACKKDLNDRNETTKIFNSTLTDEEKLIIATAMRKFWFNDKLYNLDLIKQRMSNKDWRLTSQAEHMLRLTVLNQELDKEISRMIVSYTVYAY